MNPTTELVRALRREAIEDARRETFEQKFLAGALLFDYACEATKMGIRMQNPDFDEQQVMEELRRRLEMDARRGRERAWNATEVLVRVVDALDRLRVPYMVVGSFSSNVWGRSRSTKDADFVVELGDVSISQLATAIGTDFRLDDQMSFETITSTIRYRLRHRDTAFLIELFLLSDEPFDRSRFARRVKGVSGGRGVHVPTAEDVVIQKLRWSRHPGREQDLQDVRDVIAVQADRLDLSYIRTWCDQHGTRELFERLLKEESDSVPR